MILDDEVYLEHYGKKGMRWGKRGTARVQKIVDRNTRIAGGTASAKDRVLGANRGTFTKKGAARQLQRAANNQAKVNAGKLKVTNAMAVLGGVKIKNVKYPVKGDANAKLDRGQKAALAFAGAVLVSNGATILRNR